MSSISEALQKVQEKREAVRSNGQKNGKVPLILGIFLVIILLALIAFNVRLFLIVKTYPTDKLAMSAKMSSLEELVNNNTKRLSVYSSDISKEIKQMSADLDTLRANLQEANSVLITRIESDRNTQKSALDNLAKTTDNLSSKLRALEKEIKDLRTASAPPAEVKSPVTGVKK